MKIPGESTAYRAARDRLLAAEADLRAQTEAVAALRRALPDGAPPREDYVFAELDGGSVKLSELTAPGRDSLFLYSLMFAPDHGQAACPMCVAFLDSLDGAAPHIGDQASIAVAAKADVKDLAALAKDRGWRHLRLLSLAGNSFNQDYGAETPDGDQLPMAHVWRQTETGLRHFWTSELFAHESDWPHHPRHIDSLWPLWNVLDLTPKGRGDVWFPRLAY